MRVPGSNLMNIALRVISSQTVQWFAYTNQSLNLIGVALSNYAAPVTVNRCSVQAVPRDRYEEFQLDWQKEYVYWYVPDVPGRDIGRYPSENGDVIECFNRRYQMIGQNDWYNQDRWSGFLCVDIGPATGALTNA